MLAGLEKVKKNHLEVLFLLKWFVYEKPYSRTKERLFTFTNSKKKRDIKVLSTFFE